MHELWDILYFSPLAKKKMTDYRPADPDTGIKLWTCRHEVVNGFHYEST